MFNYSEINIQDNSKSHFNYVFNNNTNITNNTIFKKEENTIPPNKEYFKTSFFLIVLNRIKGLTKDILKNNNSFGGFCLGLHDNYDIDPKQINKIFSNEFFMKNVKKIDTTDMDSFYHSLCITIKEMGYKFKNEDIDFYDNIKSFITYEKVKDRINEIKEIIKDIEQDLRKKKK